MQNLMNSCEKKARAIAFYLPQFHPIPENDEWWGKGFTEWTNVAKARRLFIGHKQPRFPTDLGYYDLRVPEVREAQAKLAEEHGLEGFCYWHYWFAGKRVLERPFDEVLSSGRPNFPFCLAWANETWTGIWHGAPNKILIKQTYPGVADYEKHFYALLSAFQDPRYIRISDRPIFIIYRPHHLPDPSLFVDVWNNLAVKEGLGEFHFSGVIHGRNQPELPQCFDSTIFINPDYSRSGTGSNVEANAANKIRFGVGSLGKQIIKKIISKAGLPLIYSYSRAISTALKTPPGVYNFPCIFSNWDNTPRSGANGRVYVDSTPIQFAKHLREAIDQVSRRPHEERLIFVRSWNEWAEGNYLEPDLMYGRAFLEAMRSELKGP